MSDLFDQASALEQHMLDVALTHRKPSLKPIGKCYWCETPVPAPAQFCDADCRDDHAQYHRRTNGGF
ncbi:MAG TPA: hypothetical protein DF774_02305 [Rheinheimera sp.]|nr:hypothetical protein [Rheinheimera sp.]